MPAAVTPHLAVESGDAGVRLQDPIIMGTNRVTDSFRPAFILTNTTGSNMVMLYIQGGVNNGGEVLRFYNQALALGNGASMMTMGTNKISTQLDWEVIGNSSLATLTASGLAYLNNGASVSGDSLAANAGLIVAGGANTDTVHATGAGTFDTTVVVTGAFTSQTTASIPTNTAARATSSNPTNSYTTGLLYTNANQRSLLVGAAVLNGGVSGSALIACLYTNGGVGYRLPMQTGAGLATTDQFPFCVPLDPNAVFTFVSTMGTGASGSLTNVILWRQ